MNRARFLDKLGMTSFFIRYTCARLLNGNIYLSGGFTGTTTFGNTTLTSRTSNVFVAKLTDAGATSSFNWAQRAGGTNNDGANALAISGTSVFITGVVSPPASFGAIPITSVSANSVAFLASLTDPTLTATAASQSSLSFTLSPNPARTAATVQLPAVPGTTTATLTLLDALGRTVRTATLPLPATGLRHELDLRGLVSGLYALQVRAGAATATRRLVVE